MAIHATDEYLWGEDANRLLEMQDPMGYLLGSDGWKYLSKIGEKQAALRTEMLLSPKVRIEGPSDDFLKGAIFGIQLLLATPKNIMEQAKQIRDYRAQEVNPNAD